LCICTSSRHPLFPPPPPTLYTLHQKQSFHCTTNFLRKGNRLVSNVTTATTQTLSEKTTLYSPVVTICTAQRSLYVPQSGHYMYRTAVTICTAQWSLYVPHSGHYMYRTAVTICTTSLTDSTFCSHSCIYVFCVDLRTNSDYFPIQHKLTGFYN